MIGVTCAGLVRPAASSPGEMTLSHKPPREEKKKPLLNAKEKKAARQQKKQAAESVPLPRKFVPAP